MQPVRAGLRIASQGRQVAGEGTFERARPGHALAQAGEQAVDDVAVEPCQRGDLRGGVIGGPMPLEPAELVLGKS
jgi:hypothetical protein